VRRLCNVSKSSREPAVADARTKEVTQLVLPVRRWHFPCILHHLWPPPLPWLLLFFLVLVGSLVKYLSSVSSEMTDVCTIPTSSNPAAVRGWWPCSYGSSSTPAVALVIRLPSSQPLASEPGWRFRWATFAAHDEVLFHFWSFNPYTNVYTTFLWMNPYGNPKRVRWTYCS
jgi:hypothetical protein